MRRGKPVKRFAFCFFFILLFANDGRCAPETHSSEVTKLLSESLAKSSQGDVGGALSITDQALKLEPRSKTLLANRATYLNFLGRYQEAVETGKKLTDFYPDFAEAYVSLAMSYSKVGNRQGQQDTMALAAKAYERRLIANPKDDNARAQRALVIASLGRKDEAELILNEMIKTNSASSEALNAKNLLSRGGLEAFMKGV